MRVEAEPVSPRHSKPCERCENLPTVRRLVITIGTGRSGKTYILCRTCGNIFVKRRISEAENLLEYLNTGEGVVRLPPVKGDPTWGGYGKKNGESKPLPTARVAKRREDFIPRVKSRPKSR
jgi:hypothetical protein